MDTHIITILLFSILGILIFIVPHLLKDRLLTTPIFFVVLGAGVFSLPIDLPLINPDDDLMDRLIIEYLTEFIVIVSLSAIGLKIDRKPTFQNWKVAIYLLGLVMPITIGLMYIFGSYLLGLGTGAAVLLGAVLAPTDPVLANNVQVGPPNEGEDHPVRFSLTVEAGLNDGLAFPFVFLALALEKEGLSISVWKDWLWHDFFVKIAVGLVMGYLMGKLLSKLFFWFISWVDDLKKLEISEGLFVIAASFLCYGLTEVVGGYGFLAVFVTSVVARQMKNDHPMHQRTYSAIDQVEQTVLLVFLFVFGGLLTTVDFADITYIHILVALLSILAIRPLAGILGLGPADMSWKDKGLISFLGIRGIGSIYYLSFAHNQLSTFRQIDEVWFVVTSSIVLSIFIHGISARVIERRQHL